MRETVAAQRFLTHDELLIEISVANWRSNTYLAVVERGDVKARLDSPPSADNAVIFEDVHLTVPTRSVRTLRGDTSA